jgi:hypothetical protein
MHKKIIGILVCLLLIIPVTVSASCKIINNEDEIDNKEFGFWFVILYGRIYNLTEEIHGDENYYTFDYIFLIGIEFIYFAPFEFQIIPFSGENGHAEISKDRFRGFINENYILGRFLIWIIDTEYPVFSYKEVCL